MADIHLTAGDDVYVQPESDKNLSNNFYGEDGNDIVRIYQGGVVGGKGDDTIERLADPSNPNRRVDVIYWTSTTGVEVNLAEGWANDGLGGRDTLIGVSAVNATKFDDRVVGSSSNNYFYSNGGRDFFDGGAGTDTASIWYAGFRLARLDELLIRVSPDGRTAQITSKVDAGFGLDLVDVEVLNFADSNGVRTDFLLAGFLTAQSIAEQAIAAGSTMRWNAAQAVGTTTALTYSFVNQSPQPGFRAFTVAEQQAVRDILAKTAFIAGLTFTEITESGNTVGQLRFGINQQAASKGQAAMPGTQGDAAGDVWMDVESMVDLTPGSEGYAALLHEIGHALGLRHPRNTDPGENWPVQMRASDDRPSWTVMSSQPSADGLFRADWGLLDVIALRYLYGTKMVATGDSTYTLGARESAAEVTVIDDGGNDTIDASNLLSGVSLDLIPGHLGSAGLTSAGFAGVENLGIAVGTLIENATGTPFDDVLLGNDADNRLTGGLGNDWIEGGNGSDVAIFAGKRGEYLLSTGFGKTFVEARDGVSGFDTLIGIEALQFADQTVRLAATALGGDGEYRVDEDARLTASLPDPSDVTRDKATYKLIAQGAHGSATVSADGQLVYTPVANYNGTDVLTFELVSGTGANRYQAFIKVLPVNDGPPVSQDTTLLVAAGAVLRGSLPKASDVDGDPITYAATADAKNGEVVVSPDGSLRYTPKAGFQGNDGFTFIVGDGLGGTNTYSATLVVVPVAATREGTAAADQLEGTAAADGLLALAGNDRLRGAGGNDVIDGGSGIDSALYSGARNQFRLVKAAFGWTVEDTVGIEGKDSLANIERLSFSNTSLALDLDGNAGSVAQIIRALFGSVNLGNKAFVGIGLQLFDTGTSYADVVRLAVSTDLFAQLAGGRSNTEFVNFVYKNVIDVPASAGELATYVGLLDAGVYTQDSLAQAACQIGFNTASAELVGLAATGIEFMPQG